MVLRGITVLVGTILAAAIGYALFVRPVSNLADILGILLVILTAVVGSKFAGSIADSFASTYNVAEVPVEGPITRDGESSGMPTGGIGAGADDITEQIETADADDSVEALIVKLNTPGGEIVPSEDIRIAADRFDGPTIAYATDLCASGGYDIASGCDEIWAREGSIVGSIGVIGSRVNAKGLADRLGLEYKQLTAGDYKDAGMPLKEWTEDEREYLQGLIDEYYEQFVEKVAEGRDVDAAAIRDTEAKVFLGTEARELGLVDELGTREDVEDDLESRLGEPVSVKEFKPSQGLAQRFKMGTQQVAYAFGQGIASVFDGDLDGIRFR
jgi:protease-4